MKPPSDKERRLFRRAVSGTRRLEHDAAAPRRPPPAPVPAQRLRDHRAVLEALAGKDPAATACEEEVETGEELCFARAGVSRTLMRRLRRGQFVVQAELDLHGRTTEEAHEDLGDFLRRARVRNWRCVRIIHGKGRRSPRQRPVLKTKVDAWLRMRDDVLAFCSAPPNDGGTGALYVLLKRRRPGRTAR